MASRRKRYSTAEILEEIFRNQSSESDSERESASEGSPSGETSSTDDAGKCIIASDNYCLRRWPSFESTFRLTLCVSKLVILKVKVFIDLSDG